MSSLFIVIGLVSDFQYAEMIRHVLDTHSQPIPAVLEIPSKDHPYDPTKDSILRRARVRFFPLLFAKTFSLHGMGMSYGPRSMVYL